MDYGTRVLTDSGNFTDPKACTIAYAEQHAMIFELQNILSDSLGLLSPTKWSEELSKKFVSLRQQLTGVDGVTLYKRYVSPYRELSLIRLALDNGTLSDEDWEKLFLGSLEILVRSDSVSGYFAQNPSERTVDLPPSCSKPVLLSKDFAQWEVDVTLLPDTLLTKIKALETKDYKMEGMLLFMNLGWNQAHFVLQVVKQTARTFTDAQIQLARNFFMLLLPLLHSYEQQISY